MNSPGRSSNGQQPNDGKRYYSNWENPNVPEDISPVNKYHSRSTLVYSVISITLSMLLLAIPNLEQEYVQDLFDGFQISHLAESKAILIAFYAFSCLFFVVFLIGMVRYLTPAPLHTTAKLTNRQRELLGLPPLSGAPSIISDRRITSPPINSPNVSQPGRPSSLADDNYLTPKNTNNTPLSSTSAAAPVPSTPSSYSNTSFGYSPATTPSSTYPYSPSTPGTPATPYQTASLSSPYYTPNTTSSPMLRESDSGIYRRTPFKIGSPAPTDQLYDETSLERFLQEQAHKEEVKSKLDLYGVTPPPIQKYRTAYRPLVRSSTPRGGILEEIGVLNTQAAEELLEKLGVEMLMDLWIERMRKWLVTRVLKPIVSEMNAMESVGLPLTNPDIPLLSTATPAAPTGGSLWVTSSSLFPSAPTPQQQQQQAMDDLINRRHRLEKYMKVLGASSREYLVKRIRDLSEGTFMSCFNWNGGGAWKDKEWTPELPTDAQILIHLFCTFMDQKLPDQQFAHGKPFTAKHLVTAPDSPDANKGNVIIFQRQIHPPHFELVTQPKETWPVAKGRDNLFRTLVLFVYCVKERYSGYLGQILLSNKQLDLLSIVEK